MTRTTLAGIVLLVLSHGLVACGGPGSVSTPSAPSAVQPAASLPFNVGGVHGKVVDTADRPLAGAVIEVVDGPHAGLSATSGLTGEFDLRGSFNDATVFRATKADHITATQSWRSDSTHPWLMFYLGVVPTPVNLAGDYVVTFTADQACAMTLPAELRTRTYAMTITAAQNPIFPTNTRFIIAASGGQFEAPFNWFSVGVAGDYLAFWLGDEHLIEELGQNTYLELGGAAVGFLTSTTSTISASFDGAFNYCTTRSDVGPFSGCSYFLPPGVAKNASCASANHRLVLTRQ